MKQKILKVFCLVAVVDIAFTVMLVLSTLQQKGYTASIITAVLILVASFAVYFYVAFMFNKYMKKVLEIRVFYWWMQIAEILITIVIVISVIGVSCILLVAPILFSESVAQIIFIVNGIKVYNKNKKENQMIEEQ